MQMYIVYYRYKNQTTKKLYSTKVPVFSSDVEYVWRMSPLNVPNTVFVSTEHMEN